MLTRIVSPTWNFSRPAVPWSITTSPGPVAQWPARSRNGVSRSVPRVRASKPTPKYGPPSATWPSRPTISAVSVMSPAATVTPGARRTASSVDAGMVGACARTSAVCEPRNAVLATTTASVPS